MADADSNVEMSPPTTPTLASSTLSPLMSTPTQRSQNLVSQTDIKDRERVAEEYAKSLDGTTRYIQDIGLSKDIGNLEKALAKLGPEGGAVKAILKVKSGIAIVDVDGKHAEKLLDKVESITSVLGGKVEKAKECITYVVDHVPRKLHSLDGVEIQIIEESTKKEVETITSLVPTRISWSKNTLAKPGPTGTIVASFTKHTQRFRLFGTSSLCYGHGPVWVEWAVLL
ncbi:hypothetical protein EPUL_003833 [Erysiphe pulchra]|uniref:Uncharacterized protein n=1 Tax=Erysiphe pulchra TaxID=225359 RepID=A0A2S4PSL4_9PEZI|nr:hypothetical protein EPUL_003833 [Erysiphe pulchra]